MSHRLSSGFPLCSNNSFNALKLPVIIKILSNTDLNLRVNELHIKVKVFVHFRNTMLSTYSQKQNANYPSPKITYSCPPPSPHPHFRQPQFLLSESKGHWTLSIP